MKVTSSIYVLAFAAVSMASGDYYASSAPAVPAPTPGIMTPAPQVPPAMPTAMQPVPVTPIPVIADFIYSPGTSTQAPMLPTPTMNSAEPSMPPAAPAYVASSAPANSPTVVMPANPVAQPEPSSPASAMPVPSPSYRASPAKREITQTAMEDLVKGTGAVVFNANGNSYMLLRLPVDTAKQVTDSNVELRKRANESDLVSDATTKNLNSDAVLYDVLGQIFARVILPVNAKVGISNPEDSNGLLRRDVVDGLLGEVIASVVAPINIMADINPDEDGNGLVPNLLGRVSATIQASPTITAHIFDPDNYDGAELERRDLVDGLLGDVVASVVAPVNIVANINPDEDGNGLVPNLLGRVSATIQASPTVTLHIFDPDNYDGAELERRDLVDGLLGEVVASVVAPLNVVANINPDEDGNGLVPNLLGRVSATIQASPTITAHIFDPDNYDGSDLLRRDLVDGLLGEVVASVVAPVNVVANINPDEDGNGLVPNLLGRVSATIQASPTITAHIFDPDNYDGAELERRDLVDGLLGEVVASVVAPVNIMADINPDEDGNGLVPNLLGRVSATIQASPTITAHIFDPDNYDGAELERRDLVDGLLGDVVASVVAPVNIVANINPDEDGNGLVPNLLGRVSATIQASPTVTLHIFDPDNYDGAELERRDLVDGLLGEVVASVVAPLNVVANINPDEDGNGLVPNLLGRVSATIQASPTITAHIFDPDNYDGSDLLRRDVVDGLLGEVIASVVAPLNIVANINPDEDGNGLVPNLLGRVSATIQASPTVTAHIFDPDNYDGGMLLKRDVMPNGIYTERIDDGHIAVYVPLNTLTKGKEHPAVSSLASVAGADNVQIVSVAPTPTMPVSSAPTPAMTSVLGDNIYLRIVVPSTGLF
ncbi:hypothetical protein LPJ57_002659 [Coemansia sp. RSA 486]|nr:hypothetical protein LPJ57_002659 [Coemansia sp. RSA 486]